VVRVAPRPNPYEQSRKSASKLLQGYAPALVAPSVLDRRNTERASSVLPGPLPISTPPDRRCTIGAAFQCPEAVAATRFRVFMQVEGNGQRISADNLRAGMDQSITLLRCFLRFAHVFAVQSGHTALANAEGNIEERLARWLLMTHDRIECDTLPLTHEFLALTLGTRRAGVTTALGHFEHKGVVTTARGAATVQGREGLEECANGLYGAPEAEFERLFGGP
jgi:Crp-like helix-turn-helix domain